jgi:ketosteroid isomerase-like protein
MNKDPKALALEYLDAVSKREFCKLNDLLAPDLKFTGPSMTRSTAQDFIAALKRLGAIHVRNEVKRVFADGDEACVIYDFVTDTPAGALPTIEWLRFAEGRIRSINLYYDRVPWKTVMDEMTQRGAQATA